MSVCLTTYKIQTLYPFTADWKMYAKIWLSQPPCQWLQVEKNLSWNVLTTQTNEFIGFCAILVVRYTPSNLWLLRFLCGLGNVYWSTWTFFFIFRFSNCKNNFLSHGMRSFQLDPFSNKPNKEFHAFGKNHKSLALFA